MGPKPQSKARPSTLPEHDLYRGEDEFRGGGLSQDGESYDAQRIRMSTESKTIPIPYKPSVDKKDAMKPDKSLNTDSVSLRQETVFTRVCIIQWSSLVITFVVCAVFLTLYFNRIKSDLEDNIKTMKTELKEAGDILAKMKADAGALETLHVQARLDKQANLLVLLSGVVIGLILSVFYLYERTTRKGNMEPPLVPQRDLGQKACIILFSDKVREEIRKLVEELKMPHFGYEFCVITREADIAKLPKCKVFMMCCEFTERHVIIEEKGLGLGNLHRTTYERAMEINGKLILLYIHDPGSRNIMDKHYNEKIHCVNGQPELSRLRDKGCFFSCDKKLTDFQAEKLQKQLSE